MYCACDKYDLAGNITKKTFGDGSTLTLRVPPTSESFGAEAPAKAPSKLVGDQSLHQYSIFHLQAHFQKASAEALWFACRRHPANKLSQQY